MKKGQRAEGYISEVKFPNKAVVHCEDGTLCTIKGGLPGQKIAFVVSKARKDRAEGRLLEVLESAPNEIESVFILEAAVDAVIKIFFIRSSLP